MARGPTDALPGRPEVTGSGSSLPVDLVQVAEDVWSYAQHDGSWWINTTGFVTGSRVMAVDACATEIRTRAFVDALRRAAGRSAELLVNTHSHGDHTFGNCVFGAETLVIATEAAGRELVYFAEQIPRLSQFVLSDYERVPDWGQLVIRPPDLTFPEHLDIHLDGPDVALLHFGRAAHTSGDLVAWIPSRGVLFSGDLIFNGGMPLAVSGSVAGAIETLRQIRPSNQPSSFLVTDAHVERSRSTCTCATGNLCKTWPKPESKPDSTQSRPPAKLTSANSAHCPRRNVSL